MKMKALGRRAWAFSAGHIPLNSTGKEPEFTSHDKIAVLNTGGKDAELRLTIFYEDTDPVADYAIKIKANRMRKIRFNDLIDPFPVPLDKPFGFTIKSNVRIVVQFSRVNTMARELATFCVSPFKSSVPTHANPSNHGNPSNHDNPSNHANPSNPKNHGRK